MFAGARTLQHFPSTSFNERGYDRRSTGEGGGAKQLPSALYLKLDPSEAEKSSEYAKDDVWILSTRSDFPEVSRGKGVSV